MFKRFFYQFNISRFVSIRDLLQARELLNIVLLSVLIIIASILFSIRGITKAQDSAQITGKWDQKILVGRNLSDDKSINEKGTNTDFLISTDIAVINKQNKAYILGNWDYIGREFMFFTTDNDIKKYDDNNKQAAKDKITDLKAEAFSVVFSNSGLGVIVGRNLNSERDENVAKGDTAAVDVGFYTKAFIVKPDLSIVDAGRFLQVDKPQIIYSPTEETDSESKFYIVGIKQKGVNTKVILPITVNKTTYEIKAGKDYVSDQKIGRIDTSPVCIDSNKTMHILHQNENQQIVHESFKLGSEITKDSLKTLPGTDEYFLINDVKCNKDVYALVTSPKNGGGVSVYSGGTWSDIKTVRAGTLGKMSGELLSNGTLVVTVSDGGTIFSYTSSDGKTFGSEEKVMTHESKVSFMKLVKDETAGKLHLLAMYNESVTDSATNIGKERRAFYTSRTIPTATSSTSRGNFSTCVTTSTLRESTTKYKDQVIKVDPISFSAVSVPITVDNKPVTLSVGGTFTDLQFPDPSQYGKSELSVQLSPQAPCKDAEAFAYLFPTSSIAQASDEQLKQLGTKENLTKFFAYDYALHPEHYILPPGSKSMFSERALYHALLSTEPNLRSKLVTTTGDQAALTQPYNNLISKAYNPSNKGELISTNVSIGINSENKSTLTNLGDVKFKSSTNFSSTALANSLYTNETSTVGSSIIANSSVKVYEGYQSVATNIDPNISALASYPNVPLILTSGTLELGTIPSQTLVKDLKDKFAIETRRLGSPLGLNLLKSGSEWNNVTSELHPNLLSKATTREHKVNFNASIKIDCRSLGKLCPDVNKTVPITFISFMTEPNARALMDGAIGNNLSQDASSKLALPKSLYTYGTKFSIVSGYPSEGSNLSDQVEKTSTESDFVSQYMAKYYSLSGINIINGVGDPTAFSNQIKEKYDNKGAADFEILSDYPGTEKVGAFSRSYLYGNVAYGADILENKKNVADKKFVIYRIGAKDIANTKVYAVDLNEIFTKNDLAVLSRDYEVSTTTPPQLGLTVDVAFTNGGKASGCTPQEYINVIVNLKKKNSSTEESYLFVYAPGAYLQASDSRNLDICSSFVANNIEDGRYWKVIKVPYNTRITTSAYTSSISPNILDKVTLISEKYNGTNKTGELVVNQGINVPVDGASFFKNGGRNFSTPIAASTNRVPDLTADPEYSFTLSATKQLSSTELIYKSVIGPTGQVTLIVTARNDGTNPVSTRFGIAQWDGTKSLEREPELKIYDLKKWYPDLSFVEIGALAVNPETGQVAMVFNTATDKDGKRFTYPVMIRQTLSNSDQYDIINFNPEIVNALYPATGDNYYKTADGVQLLQYKAVEARYASAVTGKGYINTLFYMADGVSAISGNPERDGVRQVFYCGDKSSKKYTLTTTLDGTPNCTNDLVTYISQFVEEVTNVGPVLGLDYPSEAQKKRKDGADAYKISNDFNGETVATTDTTKDGSSIKPSEEYAEELWSVKYHLLDPKKASYDISESQCDQFADRSERPFACDKYDTALIAKLESLSGRTGRVQQICNKASEFGVSCALIIATWKQESGYSLTDLWPFGCGPLQKDYAGFDENLSCAVKSNRNNDKWTAENPYQANALFPHLKAKFADPFTYLMSVYTPLDLRLYLPAHNYNNNCNKGLVVRADYSAQLCGPAPLVEYKTDPTPGDWQRSYTDYPKGQVTDTRRNLRYALLNGKEVSIEDLKTKGDMVSPFDDRIVVTANIYPSTGQTTTPTIPATIPSNGGIADGSRIKGACDQYRDLAERTYLFDSPDLQAIDFTKVIDKCFNGVNLEAGSTGYSQPYASQKLSGGKPTQIILHITEDPDLNKDYVNLSEYHRFVVPSGEAHWKSPTYHIQIRQNGMIELGQQLDEYAVHTKGLCRNVLNSALGCNETSIGITLEGKLESLPTSLAVNKALLLIKKISEKYNIPLTNIKTAPGDSNSKIMQNNVIAHCEVTVPRSTEGPLPERNDPILPSIGGNNLKERCYNSINNFRERLEKGDITQSTPTVTSTPVPTSAPTNTSNLVYDANKSKDQVVFTIDTGDNLVRNADNTIRNNESNVDSNGNPLPAEKRLENSSIAQILDILKKKNIKTTFFVSGRFVRTFPSMLKRMVNEGHEVVNHTNNHPDLSKLNKDQIIQELSVLENAVLQQTNKSTKPYFRPPYGGINDMVIQTAKEQGYSTIMWSNGADALDWCNNPDVSDASAVAACKNSSGNTITPNDVKSIILRKFNNKTDARGTIYLMHGGNLFLPKVLEETIDTIQNTHKFKIVTLSEGLK